MSASAFMQALGRFSVAFWVLIGTALLGGVAAIDIATGPELTFSVFYLAPIVLVTWFAGRAWGLAFDLLAAIAWFMADALSGQVYAQPGIQYWNTAVRMALFVIVTFLLPALRALESERELSRTDSLTRATSRRYFMELAQREIDRSVRYKRSFALAYIDLDGFKEVNDRFGHQAGDDLLRNVVERARQGLRKTDTLARLGGDEFVALLPDVTAEMSRGILDRLQSAIAEEGTAHHQPITCSIGVVVCHGTPVTPEELIRKADELMYSVKRAGKNATAYGRA